jgi:hypothetical protein
MTYSHGPTIRAGFGLVGFFIKSQLFLTPQAEVEVMVSQDTPAAEGADDSHCFNF